MSIGLASVYTTEIDKSTIPAMPKGALGSAVLINNKGDLFEWKEVDINEFRRHYGSYEFKADKSYLEILDIFKQVGNLLVCRVAKDSKVAGIMIKDIITEGVYNADNGKDGDSVTADNGFKKDWGIVLPDYNESIFVYKGDTEVDSGDDIVFKDDPADGEVKAIFTDGSLNTDDWSEEKFYRYMDTAETIEGIVFEDTDIFAITSRNSGVWGNDISIEIKVAPSSFDPKVNTIYITKFYKGEKLGTIETSLTSLKNGYGVQLFMEDLINGTDEFIKVLVNDANPKTNDEVPTISLHELKGGDNGVEVDLETLERATSQLYNKDEFGDVVAIADLGITEKIPGFATTLQSLAEGTKGMLAFIQSAPYGVQTQGVEKIVANKNAYGIDSSYVVFTAPATKTNDIDNNIRNVIVSGTGAVMGNFLKVYTKEPFTAPAGWEKGILQVNDVCFTYNDKERETLTEAFINTIRKKKGKGIALFDNLTSQSADTSTRYINVRALLIHLKKVVEDILENYQFRNNTAETRELLRDLVTFEVQKLKNQGGLYNFKVVCDESNNTPESISQGKLILDYYLDPAIPYRIGQARAIIVKTGESFDSVQIG